MLLIAAALAWDYHAASIGALLDYVDRAAAEPACRAPAVVASLNRSLDGEESGWQSVAVILARDFQLDQEPEAHITQWRLRLLQQFVWLRVIGGRDRLAAAFCAVGGTGRDRNLAAIGAMVGIRDITQTDAHTLRALTDTYLYSTRWRMREDKIRERFQYGLHSAS